MKSFKQFIKEQRTRYYHGSSDAVLPDGSYKILPPNVTGKLQELGRKKNLNQVFFTTDPKSAKIYAGRAVKRFGGNPVVKRFIPMGDIKTINNKKGTSVHSCEWGFCEPLENTK